MGLPKHLSLFPEELYRLEAYKDGRAHEELFSMKELGRPDPQYQARVLHLNVSHVQYLEGEYLRQGRLASVVIFFAIINKRLRYILVDGHHRHAAISHAKGTSIWAHVIQCEPNTLEREARYYSAICNQHCSLQRYKEDKRKAVESLFEVPEFRLWEPTRIADCCGVAVETAKKYLGEYLLRHKLDLPETIIPIKPPVRQPTQRSKPGSPYQEAPNRPRPLSPLPRLAAPIGPETEPKTDDRPPLFSPRNIREWLLRRGVLAESAEKARELPGILGLLTAKRSIVLCSSILTNDMCSAIGRLVAFHGEFGEQRTPTVLIYEEGADKKIMAVFRKAGYDLMSPMDLVKAEKA